MYKILKKIFSICLIGICATMTNIQAKATSVLPYHQQRTNGVFALKLTDADTNKGIVGAEFLIKKVGDEREQSILITTETEDADALLSFGDYEVTYYKKPKGYDIPDYTYRFTLNEKTPDVTFSILVYKLKEAS